jgi:hypothetical protein
MKMHIEMDMTPQEARALMGLPDIAPVQQKMMEQMQARMQAAVEAGDPEGAMRAWMPLFYGPQGGAEAVQAWQKALWDSAAAMVGAGAGKSGGK